MYVLLRQDGPVVIGQHLIRFLMREVVCSCLGRVIPKTIIKYVQTVSLLSCRHCGKSLAVQPSCVKVRLMCGTVYEDMYYKDLLGSIARVGYCIQVLDFHLVLHD